MASLSPQRSRRSQAQPLNQGPMRDLQPRDGSPSPSLRDRPRALKTQSMPMVPSVTAFAAQQGSQSQQQPSPTISNTSIRRSPPLAQGQITRLLPTPPHPNPPGFQDLPDRRPSPPTSQQPPLHQSNINSQYARPVARAPAAQFLNRFQNIDESHFQMTPELLADIERADQQLQAQYQSQPHSYTSGPRGDSPSPPTRSPNVERVRAPPDRSSPNHPDNGQQRRQREQQVARESPKVRERQPAIVQAQMQEIPSERRMSPAQHSPLALVSEPHSASYLAQYNARESPPNVRRPGNSEARLNVSMANQAPPSQGIPARTPDRSLPVQEEAEDEITSKNGAGAHQPWQNTDQSDPHFHSPSPTPSSDLNPDGNTQRHLNGNPRGPDSRKDLSDDSVSHHVEVHAQYTERDSTEEESGGYTPRSPTTQLPEETQYHPGQNLPNRVPVPASVRPKPRNGATEQQMRGLESTLLDKPLAPPSAPVQQPQQQPERPPKYAEQQRQPTQYESQQQNQQYSTQQEYSYPNGSPADDPNARYLSPPVYPEEFQHYHDDSASGIYQAYSRSPRPEGPIPPTPHSQTAAPSPSPLVSGYVNGKEYPSYRPLQGAGSPYPYPFNHVRRNRQSQRYFDPNNNPVAIAEQVARQWQVFAQNNQHLQSESTFSPSSTPVPPDMFNHWAYLHTNRMMRGMPDTASSLHSSPSHQPIPLPIPPNFSSVRKKTIKRHSFNRKPPPRVQSTQPRETSPEPSSSGEETAGEERPGTQPSASDTACEPPEEAITIPIMPADPNEPEDGGDWVDDEDEDDYEDLIDLEYHPSFVRNISKRRRKWEVGWENLIQAFQALDRQTDATMVLLASPSHTTKLHSLRSRAIRRQGQLSKSSDMRDLRTSFAHLAAERRATRPEKTSLVDRLLVSSSTSGDGSDGSSGSVEDNLRRALDAALGSLGTLGGIYEQREARVLEELQRSREDRERVELLLKQVLGENPGMVSLTSYSPMSQSIL